MSLAYDRKTEMREVVVSEEERIVCNKCDASIVTMPHARGALTPIPDGWMRVHVCGKWDGRDFCPTCAPKALAALDAIKEPTP